MSDTALLQPIVDDTTVPVASQVQLQTYWQLYSPYRGEIITLTVWDDGTTTWDDGTTNWLG